jgi:hypothetical protein
MIDGGIGGATTKTGLAFEKEVDFQELILKIQGYEFKDEKDMAGRSLYFNGLTQLFKHQTGICTTKTKAIRHGCINRMVN